MSVEAREVAALVRMPQLLAEFGFAVNERTRRGPCLLHSGSNPTAFSWREDGRWHCFSCGRGGDRIALVRAVRHCGFADAVKFLAQLAGVEYSPRKVARRDIERARIRRARAESAAWRVRDREIGLVSVYRDGLHRAERLMARFISELGRTSGGAERDAILDRMVVLVWPQTFFAAAYHFLFQASAATLTRFALASPAKRRRFILDGVSDERRAAT